MQAPANKHKHVAKIAVFEYENNSGGFDATPIPGLTAAKIIEAFKDQYIVVYTYPVSEATQEKTENDLRRFNTIRNTQPDIQWLACPAPLVETSKVNFVWYDTTTLFANHVKPCLAVYYSTSDHTADDMTKVQNFVTKYLFGIEMTPDSAAAPYGGSAKDEFVDTHPARP